MDYPKRRRTGQPNGEIQAVDAKAKEAKEDIKKGDNKAAKLIVIASVLGLLRELIGLINSLLD